MIWGSIEAPANAEPNPVMTMERTSVSTQGPKKVSIVPTPCRQSTSPTESPEVSEPEPDTNSYHQYISTMDSSDVLDVAMSRGVTPIAPAAVSPPIDTIPVVELPAAAEASEESAAKEPGMAVLQEADTPEQAAPQVPAQVPEESEPAALQSPEEPGPTASQVPVEVPEDELAASWPAKVPEETEPAALQSPEDSEMATSEVPAGVPEEAKLSASQVPADVLKESDPAAPQLPEEPERAASQVPAVVPEEPELAALQVPTQVPKEPEVAAEQVLAGMPATSTGETHQPAALQVPAEVPDSARKSEQAEEHNLPKQNGDEKKPAKKRNKNKKK